MARFAVSLAAFVLLLHTAVQATGFSSSCSPPRRPTYGGYYGSRRFYSPGSVVNFYCNKGYKIHGRSWTLCIYDNYRGARWLYAPPVCRPHKVVKCGRLDDPQNGDVRISGTSIGSKARYTCNVGFERVGQNIRVCKSNGKWSGEAPICRPVNCGRLSNPSNGKVSFKSTTFRSKASYSCQSGYILVGKSTRVCQANGKWSGEAPICKIVRCGDLPDPKFGSVSLSGEVFGSTATYSCRKGYLLVGRRTRTCQANGQWSGKAPVCRIVTCDDLSDPRAGSVVLSGTTFGSTATYSCRKGYLLVGQRTRTCQANGQWSGKAPVCRIVTCDDLSDPRAGSVVLSGTTFGSTATYSCRKGYLLVGQRTRTCQANGQWSGKAPVCKIIRCGDLPDPKFGSVSLSGEVFGSTATYSCRKGYLLVGQRTRTCQANGRWSGKAPVCRIVTCDDLSDPRAGSVVLSGTTFGSTATYSCRKGYLLVGLRIRTCQANGQWSGEAPVCRIITCDRLSNPKFGSVVLSGVTFGSTATYSCRKGYFLVGQSTRRCQANGEWSGEAPICRIINCGNLPAPKFGSVSLTGVTFGSTATYSCRKGYVLVGVSVRTCQANGQWSGRAPICKIVDCGNLSNPRFGKVVLSGTVFGSTATYSCQPGYILVGQSTRSCQADGDWSGRAPVCRPVECEELDDIENGRVKLSGTTVGSKATYSCVSGYVLVGNAVRVCRTSGRWSGSEPFCKIVDCGSLANPKFGKVRLSGSVFGSTATYSCQRGYELVGQRTRKCQANGRWSGKAPFCQIVDCGSLSNPKFGRVVITGTTFGSTATYDCVKGYVLVGQSTRSCQANGVWSGEAPVCKVVSCGELTNPRFGSVSVSGTVFGSTASYSCRKGYILIGQSRRVCRGNGQWSGEAPRCRIVDCGPLANPKFGSVTLRGTTFGSTATYSCIKGYFLVGVTTRNCQATGDWSGQAPICQANNCPLLRNPRFGKVVLSGQSPGSTATYVCFKGYLLVGNARRSCQPNGQWDGSAPSCKLVDCGLTIRPPDNGFAHVPCTKLGCTTTFWCRSGFGLSGKPSQTCLPSGHWSGETPRCTRKYY